MRTFWTITIDKISEPDEKSAVGITGPSTCELTAHEIKTHPYAILFRLLDADGEIYYYGKMIEGDELECNLFAPLDDFGTGYAGCTEIQVIEGGVWTTV